jgi:hypothetical protein
LPVLALSANVDAPDALSAVGSIKGVVLDSNGAVIPGARVRVSTSVGLIRSTVTDDRGTFVFADLDPEMYEVEVQVAGFKRHSVQKVHVLPGTELKLEIVLQVPEAYEVLIGVVGIVDPEPVVLDAPPALGSELILRKPTEPKRSPSSRSRKPKKST